MITTVSGKGGLGKTTVCAFLLDELARMGFEFKLLIVDGDPAMALVPTLSGDYWG